MSKVYIQSRDRGYALYLQSLVQQIQCEPELEVHCILDPHNCPQEQDISGLLIVYQSADFDADSAKHLLHIMSWDQIVWITQNGESRPLQTQGSKIDFFTRPLNVSDFVDCVHQWSKMQGLGHQDEQTAPKEPFLMGNSQAIRLLRKNIARVSPYDISVLVCGATGTGKGVVAKSLHNNSSSFGNRFVNINCANVPASLLESELFGYKKGAFTGAWGDKQGRFELAEDGTVFLDEISEMTPSMQAKLLQVLQEKEFWPLGGGHSGVQVNARIIAATNTDLQTAIAHGFFRKDLYYRLAAIRCELPKLRERKEDVPVLVHYFVDTFCKEYNKDKVPQLSDAFWDVLMSYDWPGNVRELESSIKTVVALDNEEMVLEELCKNVQRPQFAGDAQDIFANGLSGLAMNKVWKQELSLQEIVEQAISWVEAELIRNAMHQTGRKKKKAAQLLDMSYKSLLNKVKTYGL
ncbi:MAG: sigma 54-interacting transcriptional regulator [Desulfovermiculus sp.]